MREGLGRGVGIGEVSEAQIRCWVAGSKKFM